MKLPAISLIRGTSASAAVTIAACVLVAAVAALAVVGLKDDQVPTVGTSTAVLAAPGPVADAITTGGSPPTAADRVQEMVNAPAAETGPATASDGDSGSVAASPPPQEGSTTKFKEVWPPQGRDEDPSTLDSFGTSHLPACGEGWYTNDIAKGERSARELGIPLLLIFEKKDCKHCRHFNNVQLAEPEFAGIMKSKQMVVVKRFYDQWDKQKHNIKSTPTFKSMEWRDGKWVLTEYLPGLLELPLMRKRVRDMAEGHGRLDRKRQALEADPSDLDALKILLDEYLELYPPRQKIDMVQKGLDLDPAWTHGIAMKIYILNDLQKQGMASAQRMLEECVGAAQARLTKSAGSARDYFTVGYFELTTGQHEPGVRNLERSVEADKTDCEVLSHLSFGYVALAGLAKLAQDDDKAREQMIKAESTVNRALGYCPDSVLANTRKKYIESQWNALELRKK